VIVDIICGVDIASMSVVIVEVPTVGVTIEYFCNEFVVEVLGSPQGLEYFARVDCDSLVTGSSVYRCERNNKCSVFVFHDYTSSHEEAQAYA